MNVLRSYWGFLVVLFLSVFAILPFFHPGFFPMHDDTQVARVYEMGKALKDGMFPVRWVADLGYGYGYPIFNFYSPLPYYIGGFLNLLGFDAFFATKMTFVIGILLPVVFMYFLVRSFLGEIAAIVSSLVYLYFPYHAVNIYVRGDLDELFAYAFLPLVFLGLFKIFYLSREQLSFKKNLLWIAVSSIAIALVILSHNLSAFMLLLFMVPFVLFAVLASQDKLKVVIAYSIIFLLGFCLSSFYSLPALFEAHYTNVLSQVGGGADYQDHFVCLPQLWESPWGFGGSTKGCVDGMSFRLGKINILLFLTSIILIIVYTTKVITTYRFNNIYPPAGEAGHYSAGSRILLFSIVGFLLSIFLMIDQSIFIWNTIPFMAFLQYPWRFLNFAGFFLSVGIAFLFCFREKKLNIILAVLVVFFAVFYNAKFFTPQFFYDRNSRFYTNDLYLKWTVSKISDEYMPKDFKKASNQYFVSVAPLDLVQGYGTITRIEHKTGLIHADINADGNIKLKFNIAYFPAWKVFIDGTLAKFDKGQDGVYVSIPKGFHVIEARFVETPIERVSNAISLIGILILLLGIITQIRFQFYEKRPS